MFSLPKFARSDAMNFTIQLSSKGVGSRCGVFSSGDSLNGEIIIDALDDVHVDDIDVSFVGYSQTRGDCSALPVASTSEKEFLHLKQPIEKSPKTSLAFKSRQTYIFPFNFVIPDYLLPSSCSCRSNTSEDHLLPPPTMGGHQYLEGVARPLDDPTPDMALVVYEIKVKVLHSKHQGQGILERSSRRVCVIPQFPETPPLFLEKNSEYCLRQEKDISRGILKGRLGCLVMEAQQPGAVGSGLYSATGSVAPTTVTLRFDPVSEDDAPPTLENIRTKIQAITIFRSGPLVTSGGRRTAYTSERSYSETIPLTSLSVSGTRWQKYSADSAHQQLAAGERTDTVAPSSMYRGGCFYLVKLSIPVQLPDNKALVPTFNSCLVSRLYRLDMTLSLSSTSSLALRVPLQICR